MSSENYEANDYGHDLELAIIWHAHYLRVSHQWRSGCKAKSVHLRPAYLILPNYKYLQLGRTEFHSATFDHKSHTHSTQIYRIVATRVLVPVTSTKRPPKRNLARNSPPSFWLKLHTLGIAESAAQSSTRRLVKEVQIEAPTHCSDFVT